MNEMFRDAFAFDQDLGWCGITAGWCAVTADLSNAFTGAGCEATSCGVTDTCAPTVSPSAAPTDDGGSDAASAPAGVLFSLLAATAAWLLI